MMTDETGAELEREACGHYVGECVCDSVAVLLADVEDWLSEATDRECHVTHRSGLWRVLLWAGADYYEGKHESSLEAATRAALDAARAR